MTVLFRFENNIFCLTFHIITNFIIIAIIKLLIFVATLV